MARSPLCSMAYNKLKPQVTLCGSCFVTKSSSMPYDHFFFKSNMEWSRSSLNLDSIICSVEKRANNMNCEGKKNTMSEGYSMLHCSRSSVIQKCNLYGRQENKFTIKKSTSLDAKIEGRNQQHHFNMHGTNGKSVATYMKSFKAWTFTILCL